MSREPFQRLDVSEGKRDQNVRTAAHQGAGKLELHMRVERHVEEEQRRREGIRTRAIAEPPLRAEAARRGRWTMRRQTVLRTLREERRGQNRQAEASPGVRTNVGKTELLKRTGERPRETGRSRDRIEVLQRLGLVRFEGRARGDCLRPERGRRRAAVRRQDRRREPCRKLRQTRPMQADRRAALARDRAGEIVGGAARSRNEQHVPLRARSRTKRRASASRISLAEDSISLTWERSAWVGLCCVIELLPDAVPGHRDRPRIAAVLNHEL